ncbi:MAG TPA: hypothetical protein PLL71_18535, partial [Agriterribacter sp.]|nr:hypothetical protein [Agriterribacter sp.]
MICRVLLVCLFGLLGITAVPAQDSVDTVISLPRKYLGGIHKKAAALDKQLTRRSEKYLSRLSKQEEKLRRKLARVDSSRAAEIFHNAQQTYAQLSQKLATANGKMDKAFSGQYLPGLDSLQGTLGFLKEAKQVVSKSKDIQQKLSSSIEQVKQLQNKLQQADEIKHYVRQREEQLKTLLSSYTNLPNDITKHLGKYRQSAYYFGKQVQEYRETLN